MARKNETAGVTLARAILAGFLLCAGCSAPPPGDAFETGMSRDEVVARFGEPRRRTSIRKTETPIWGAIETLSRCYRRGESPRRVGRFTPPKSLGH